MSDVSAVPHSPSAPNDSIDSGILMVLMETIPDRIYFKNLHSRIIRNNAAHARSLGAASPDACIGKSDYDFFSKEHADRAYADEQNIIRTGQPIIGKIERLTMRDGKQGWASTTKMPWRNASGQIIGTFGLSRDVTATKDAEEKLIEERNLLRTIIDHLPSRIFVKDVASNFVLNNRAHLEALGVKLQSDALGRTTLDFFPGVRGQEALADDRKVIASGEPIINQEKSDHGAEGRARWALTTKVPLRDLRGKIAGIVGISHDITRRKLAEEELQRRTDEMQADVEMARQIQESFLPRTYPVFPRSAAPDESALRFAHRYIPATTLGGDFFHVTQLSDTKCGILVCDVMGHGVRAGLITALIRGVLEELGDRAEDPAKVLSEVNHTLTPILEKTGQPMFATAFFGVIDIVAQTLVCANAGHPPPFVLRRGDGTVQRLSSADPEPAAGLVENFHYESTTYPFLTGDALLGFTDGLFEAADPSDQMFGEERLQALVHERIALPCGQLIEHIVSEIQRFSGHANFEDDLCVIAVESAPAAAVR